MHHCYSACVPSITIRNVPSETRDELAARAAAAGWSLQEYLLSELVELARRPDVATWTRSVEDRIATTGSTLDGATIVEYLDEIRR